MSPSLGRSGGGLKRLGGLALTAWAAWVLVAPPAWAWRYIGPRLSQEAPSPTLEPGWCLGPAIASPFALGLSGGYTAPPTPLGWKLGGHWGVLGPNGELLAVAGQDWRAFGALTYAVAPAPERPGFGPYLELGLGRGRSRQPLRDLGWPLTPHLGFGTLLGTPGQGLAWDLNFAVQADGLMVLQAGLLIGKPHDPNAPLPPWPTPTPR